jgi:hypothetical protein
MTKVEQHVYRQSERDALLRDTDAQTFRKNARILAVLQTIPFLVYTDRGPMQGQAGDWLVTNHPDDDPGSDLWTISAERMASTYEPVIEPLPHQPGDEHQYTGLICEVCGMKGQVQVTIVPMVVPYE